MARFVALTNALKSGGVIWVNLDLVQTMRRSPDSLATTFSNAMPVHTVLVLVPDSNEPNMVSVLEEPTRILQAAAEANDVAGE